MRPFLRAALCMLLAQLVLVVGSPASPAHAVSAQPVASGLAFPAAFSFLPAGRIVYGERFTGEVHFLDPVTGTDTLVYTITRVAADGEQGLLSVVPHPQYPTSPYLYAYVTRTVSGVAQNQVVRIKVVEGLGVEIKVLVRIAAALNHNGGAMTFGPSGKLLHIAVGDVGIPANAQNTSVLPGKVLRVTPEGAAATGNPFGNRVFSFGHQNMFGIAFDPDAQKLWLSENGPGCNDEINRPVKGGNYAWGPSQQCGTPPDAEDTNRDGPAPRRFPRLLLNPVIAPTGVTFCEGCGLGTATEGRLLFGNWNDRTIRSVTLTADRLNVASSSVLYDQGQGILGMARGPDGSVYFSDPDQILKLTP